MSKRRLCIYFVIAGFVILLCLTITHLREHPPYVFYKLFPGLHELPTRWIRPIFRDLTKQIELPKKTESLRAIYYSSSEPAIFVRFQTDPEGIEYILEKFGGPTAKFETFDADRMKALNAANVAVFFYPSQWQEKLGISLYDQDSIESGRKLTGTVDFKGLDRYTIFIEDQRNTVYILICTEE